MARTKESARKRKSSDYDSNNGFVEHDSDSSSSQRQRATKRSKPTTSSTWTSSTSVTTPLQPPQRDSDGNPFWEISKTRRVTISEFRSKAMVSVREYFEQNGEIKPGKKVNFFFPFFP